MRGTTAALAATLLLAAPGVAGCEERPDGGGKRAATLGDGIHLATPERRGTWNAPGGRNCRWWVTGQDGKVLRSGRGDPGAHGHTVVLGAKLRGQTVRAFRTEGCGTWVRLDPSR